MFTLMREPCADCQAALLATSELRWKRFGKWERRLLLVATADAPEKIWHLVPQQPTNSGQVAQRRALGRLVEVGLVEVDSEERRKYCDGRLMSRTRSMRGSDLALLVVPIFQTQLEGFSGGRPIRWQQILLDARVLVLDRCGCLRSTDRGRFV